MAIKDWPGGVISKTPVVPAGTNANSSASGVWTLEQVAYWQKQGIWPNPANIADPYYEYVSLLLTGDGTNGAQNNTFLDSSTNNFTITRNGNTTQGTFSPYGNLWSNYFDGSGDFLSTPDNAAFDFGTGAFAIECWFNLTADAARDGGGTGVRNAQLISAFPPSGASQPNTWALTINGDVNVTGTSIAFSTNNSSSVSTVKTYTLPSTLQKSTWHHIAVCRSGTNFAMFYDGVRVISDAAFGNDINNGGWLVRVGALGFNTYEQYFPGYISNMRVVKGSAVYDPTQSTITVPTTPLTAVSGTSLLTCQSNRFIDNSSNNFTLTVNGNTSVQRFSPFNPTLPYSATTIGGSGYFDGSGDYLTVPDSTAFDLTGDFTIETWVYPLAGVSAAGTTTYFGICLGNEASGQNGLSIYGNANGMGVYSNGANVILVTNEFSTGAWYHVAVVRSGTSLKFYLNGVEKGSATNSTSFTGVAANGFSIAAMYNSGSYSVRTNGYFSNTRIVKGTAVYTSNFTPSTTPLTAVSGTSLLCNFTNAGIPDAAMMNDLETVGNAQVSTSVKKYGTGSLAFDGSGDYLVCPYIPTMDFGTGNFTIEFWTYFNTVASGQQVISGNNGSPINWTIYTATSGNLNYYLSSNGSTWNVASGVSMGAIAINTWYHIALVRNGSTFTPYINGVAGTTTTSSSAIYNAQAPTYVGGIPSGFNFNGYIDDLRITKGYARYTANFTPPTAALPTF